MVYTSESPALAALEQLVGLDEPSALARMVLIAVDIPDAVVTDLDAAALPPNWRSYPAPPELQRLGDAWISGRASLALRVPTVVVPHQFNFLLNPLHEAFAALRPGDSETFELDERLLRRP
jgi:RES domain-containing protein